MARQAGPLFFTGTIDDITFYKMEGVYLARKKSSLTRKRFRTDPRFARSRKSAKAFGEASQLASQIYWQLPKAQRGKGVVNRLTGQVGQLLKEGKTREEVKEMLLAHCQTLQLKPAVILTTLPADAIPKMPAPVTTTKQQPNSRIPRATKAKHARYLSRWKVKRNGRLQVPKSALPLSSIQPVISCKVWPLKE